MREVVAGRGIGQCSPPLGFPPSLSPSPLLGLAGCLPKPFVASNRFCEATARFQSVRGVKSGSVGPPAAGRRLITDPLATVRHSVMCLLYGLPRYAFNLSYYLCSRSAINTGCIKDPLTLSVITCRRRKAARTRRAFRKAVPSRPHRRLLCWI